MRKIFQVNQYITLKLENKKTIIYIGGERFRQCHKVLITIPVEKAADYNSIDELIYREGEGVSADELYDIPIGNIESYGLDPETEFWAHCSNIQVWVDQNYDTRFLNSTLSFPILKKLVEFGDEIAKRVFKDEIARRFSSGYPPVVKYLVLERYLDYLNIEEKETLVQGIKRLDLMGIQLETIPDFVFIARNLKQLLLGNNYIKEIGEGVKDLRNLIEFDAWVNKIEFVSDAIGSLDKLKFLRLTKNQITIIPETIGNLVSLEELILRINKIQKLPDSIGNLINLKKLNISDNMLEEIPDSIQFLTHLEHLELYSNHLNTLPESIGRLVNLVHLNLSDNDLEELPKTIELLRNLKFLDLSGNKFAKLPIQVKHLNSLRTFYFGNNKIREISDLFEFPKGLIDLDLSGNHLKCLPYNLKDLKFLGTLSLFGNPMEELPKFIINFPNLRVLALDKSQEAMLSEIMIRKIESKKIKLLIT